MCAGSGPISFRNVICFHAVFMLAAGSVAVPIRFPLKKQRPECSNLFSKSLNVLWVSLTRAPETSERGFAVIEPFVRNVIIVLAAGHTALMAGDRAGGAWGLCRNLPSQVQIWG